MSGWRRLTLILAFSWRPRRVAACFREEVAAIEWSWPPSLSASLRLLASVADLLLCPVWELLVGPLWFFLTATDAQVRELKD